MENFKSLKTCLKWKFAPVIFFFENCTFLTAICSSTQFHPLPTAFQTHVAEMPPKYTYIFISCLSINSTHGNVYLHLWLELLICKSKYNVSKNLDEWAFQIQAHNIKDPCIHGSLMLWAWIWKAHSSRFLDTLYLLLQIRSSNHRCKYTLPCVELMLRQLMNMYVYFGGISATWVWKAVGSGWNCVELHIAVRKVQFSKKKITGANFHFRHVFKDLKFSKRGKLIFVYFNC